MFSYIWANFTYDNIIGANLRVYDILPQGKGRLVHLMCLQNLCLIDFILISSFKDCNTSLLKMLKQIEKKSLKYIEK